MDEKNRYTLESPEVRYLCQADATLGRAIRLIGEIEFELYKDPFRFLVDTIVGQMLSNRVADIISSRLWTLFPTMPTPQEMSLLAIDQLKSIGLSEAKANYISILSKTIANSNDFLNGLSLLSDHEVIRKLTSIRGIGQWSAKMYLIFVLGREDILPVEDGAFIQVIEWMYGIQDESRKKRKVEELCKNWHPYASIAARYLYKVLDSGLTKKPFINN